MTLIPFARLVKEMRALQSRASSPFPDPADLPERLVKEYAVDKAVREILGRPTLFDRDDEAPSPH